jgi:PAS domain S-box-containing protein
MPSKESLVKDEKPLIEKMPNGIVIFDLKTGRIRDVNNRAAEMIGLPKDDVLGSLITKYFPLSDEDGPTGRTGAAALPSDRYLTRPDGTRLPVDSARAAIAENGRTLVLVSLVDASEHERVERELRERSETLEKLLREHKKSSESMKKWLHCEIAEHRQTVSTLRETNKFLKSILDSSASISIISTDASGNILFWNSGAEKLFGYTYDEAVNHLNINQLYPDDERTHSAIMEIRKSIYERKQEITTEIEELTRDGRRIWINLTTCPRFDSMGNVTGVLGIGEDITERKRAEEELRESEKKYATIVQNGNDGIVILQDNIVKFVNPMLLEITGVPLEQALDRNFADFIAPEYRDAMLTRYRRRMGGQQIENNYEIELLSRLRGRVTVEISAGVVEYEGKPADLAIIRDVTERKKAKEELENGIKRLRKTLEGTIQAMAALIESRDPYTAGHQRRVTDLACAIGNEMGLSSDRIEGIRVASAMHDVGKVYVPAEILSKPGKLSPLEFNLIKVHPQVGYDILKTITFPWPVAEVVLQHHERIDGSGYPRGLTGGEISLEAKVLSIADVVEAMGTHRPYRPALGMERALEEVRVYRGKLYDPDAADACLRLFNEKGFVLG